MRWFVFVFLICAAGGAWAKGARVTDRGVFLSAVEGFELKYGIIRLYVDPKGSLSGRALGRNVSGDWSWKDGYFCRTLFWGDEDLGYNCQEVRLNAPEKIITFTSDQGKGRTADFKLRQLRE